VKEFEAIEEQNRDLARQNRLLNRKLMTVSSRENTSRPRSNRSTIDPNVTTTEDEARLDDEIFDDNMTESLGD
jgi:hypothetical protein